MAVSGRTIEYLFITADHLANIGETGVTAYNASTRLGCIAPTRALTALGYDARTCSIASDISTAQALLPAAKRIVFAEMFASSRSWAPAIGRYRALLAHVTDRRERAIFSIADDHFGDTAFREFYTEALPECLAVTTVSTDLAQTLARMTSRPVVVSPEPYEGARGAPQAFSARRPARPLAWLARSIGVSEDLWRLRLLWFGYPMNLPPLLQMLPALETLARRQPLLLTCVTNMVTELQTLMAPERSGASSPLRVRFVQWQPNVMDAELAGCDLVLIPSEYRDPVKRAKSPNRLVAGLHAGRLVVAHPLPAYEPYAPYAWIGEDLCEGIEWAARNPQEAVARIARGQPFIDQRHSPEAVARFWLDVLHPNN